jgi:pimeloyl-ACP methyl ester carboxylesterase
MKELILSVGAPTPLSGIITEPEANRAPDTAVVLLNSGVLHRVGANRLNVRVARRLAEAGLLAVRFDAAGLGESAARGPRATTLRPEVADTIEVMDHLERSRGIRRFVLGGLCSGAECALVTAAADPRVVGVVALEGYAYPTTQYWIRRYVPRLVALNAWRRVFRGEHRVFGQMRSALGANAAGEGPFSLRAALGSRRLPPHAEVEHLLQQIVARRVALLAVYAGGAHHYYNYPAQFRASFPRVAFGDLLDVAYEPQADHTFSDIAIRQRVIERIATWATQRVLRSNAIPTN